MREPASKTVVVLPARRFIFQSIKLYSVDDMAGPGYARESRHSHDFHTPIAKRAREADRCDKKISSTNGSLRKDVKQATR
jgi:hypothetical protein